jgi:hypothetical protein
MRTLYRTAPHKKAVKKRAPANAEEPARINLRRYDDDKLFASSA